MPVAALLDPPDLGFPAKFSHWREDQIIAIDRTIRSPKRFVSATAPTGFGKTLYGVAVGLLGPGIRRALYLTSTKNLQDQIAGDFTTIGLADVRGQRNYACAALGPGQELAHFRRHAGYVGCDEGPCHAGVYCTQAPDKTTPWVRPDCAYYQTVYDARGATLVSTNYAYYLTSYAYSQGLGDFDLLILDEAHNAADELEGFLTFDVSTEDAALARTQLVKSDELSHWQEWGAVHFARLSLIIEKREQFRPTDVEGVQAIRKLKAVLAKFDRLKTLNIHEWIVERDDKGRKATFSPLRVASYAERYLFRGIAKVLLTSATLTPKTLQLLGVPRDAADVMEFRSSFPVARRPVIGIETLPDCVVNARMHDSTKDVWLRRHDRIIDFRTDRKGLIHAGSYARARDIVTNSDHRASMITHGSGEAKYALAEFVRTKSPCVLVSPSMETGIDLPDDLCRFQIISKIPIPDTRGAIMQIRCEQDKELRNYLAMQRLVQAVGRAVRSQSDWAETFIVDDTFGLWFLKHARKHAPKWFLDAIEFTDTYPLALPLNF